MDCPDMSGVCMSEIPPPELNKSSESSLNFMKPAGKLVNLFSDTDRNFSLNSLPMVGGNWDSWLLSTLNDIRFMNSHICKGSSWISLWLRSKELNDFCSVSKRHTLTGNVTILLWLRFSSERLVNLAISSGTVSMELLLRSSLTSLHRLNILESILFIRHSDTCNKKKQKN